MTLQSKYKISPKRINRKFDEACPEEQGRIADFSGVEKFIDTPVKRYPSTGLRTGSSGMRVRLASSVAGALYFRRMERIFADVV